MTKKTWAVVVGAVALIAVIGVLVAGAAPSLAQTDTPAPTPESPFAWRFGARGFGMWGLMGRWPAGWTGSFDALAEALKLTPTQLFEELHSGKTVDEIAKAQGVDLAALQDELEAERLQGVKDAIAQAVKDGKITQEQADWLLKGLEQGFLGKAQGFGRGMRGLPRLGKGLRLDQLPRPDGLPHMEGMPLMWGCDRVGPTPTPVPGTSS